MPKKDIRCFIVPGRPRGKQRPRLYRNVVYTPKETIAYEAKLRHHYIDIHGDKEPFEGDLAVDVFAFFKNRQHPDLDNIVKILDGLNKVAWKDDKQIKQINAYLVIDKEQEERLVVIIRPLTKSFNKTVVKTLHKKMDSSVTKPVEGTDK